MKKFDQEEIMAMKYCDMHIHSSFSDGKLDVQELSNLCKKMDLDEFIITDHDTIDAYKQFPKLLKVSGMEITCSYEPEIHILAYGFDINDININNYCNHFKKNNYLRTLNFFRKLSSDYNMDFLEVFQNKDKISIDDIYHYMVCKGIFKSVMDVRNNFITNYKEYFIKKPLINAIDAINMIKKASGYTSVAHINRIKISDFQKEKLIFELKNSGLDAIEIFNSCYSNNEIKTVLQLSKKYDLKLTGGSDFHGNFKNYNMVKIPYITEQNRIFINRNTYTNI